MPFVYFSVCFVFSCFLFFVLLFVFSLFRLWTCFLWLKYRLLFQLNKVDNLKNKLILETKLSHQFIVV